VSPEQGDSHFVISFQELRKKISFKKCEAPIYTNRILSISLFVCLYICVQNKHGAVFLSHKIQIAFISYSFPDKTNQENIRSKTKLQTAHYLL